MAKLTIILGVMTTNLWLSVMCIGGSSKRQFAPRFMNPAHGGTSDRSSNGYIADVSALLAYCVLRQKHN